VENCGNIILVALPYLLGIVKFTMELRHLRYFIAVAEEENVTRAAERLHVSQPPLSRQIHDLEAELGVPLFDRTGKSLQLNAAGKVFLVEALQTVQALTDDHQQVIDVGYAPSLSVQILPQILRVFEQAQPHVRVRLHDLSSGEMQQGLRDGSLQAAFLALPDGTARGDLSCLKLQSHPVCVAMPAHHPLAKKRKITLAELSSHRLVGYSRHDYAEYHQWLETLMRSLPRKPVLAEEYDSMTSLITAIESGRGIALVSKSLSCFSGPRLQYRPLTPAPVPFHVALAWREKGLKKSTRALIAAVRSVVE
jgi:LysR family transcriptional regulator, benzoate and cis,cis-muconate-responsive activator of ben and cat genes